MAQRNEMTYYMLDLAEVRALHDGELESEDYALEFQVESDDPFVVLGREDRLPTESAFTFYKGAVHTSFDLFSAPLCVSVRNLRKQSTKLCIGIRASHAECTFSIEVNALRRRLATGRKSSLSHHRGTCSLIMLFCAIDSSVLPSVCVCGYVCVCVCVCVAPHYDVVCCALCSQCGVFCWAVLLLLLLLS
jgi:hypothetical protein